MGERPLWRWWLFCAASWLYGQTGWGWSLRLLGWCVLPEWLGASADYERHEEAGNAPF
jgi:hypothetical protein